LGAYLADHPDRLESVRILDPACGSGAFLNQALTFMKNAYATKRDRVYADDSALLRHLYGVDLNEESVEITKLSLWLRTAGAPQDLDTNIRVGNSLIDDPAVAGSHAFRWDASFGDVMAAGGFDVIIGNPPWVFARSGRLGREEKAYYYSSYDIANYQLNTYALFIEQSYRLLRAGGKLGFIVPNTWLTIISSEPLRRFLLEQTADLQIINVYGRVFDEAHVDCCLLLFTKGSPTKVTTGEMHDLQVEKFAPLAPDDLRGTGTAIINISLHQRREALDIISTINAAAYPLTRYATVKTGFVAYEVGKGKPAQTKEMKDARVYHSTSREGDGEGWFSYLDGRDVRRYGLGWSGQFVKYGANLAAPRDRALYQTERILVRQIPSKPPYSIHAAYTDADMLLNDRNSNIVFDFKIKPQAILGVLNSRVTSYWFAYTFDKFQRDTFPQFKLAELEQFPIPRNIKDYEAALTSYVDALTGSGNARAEALLKTIKYLEASYGLAEQNITVALTDNDWNLLNSELEAVPAAEREQIYTYFTTRRAEIAAAQRTIDELDERVDTLVFAMFGLDEDQRRVILDWPCRRPGPPVTGSRRGRRWLAEGERVSLGAGVEERDFEGALGDRSGLADELVQPLFDDRAVALFVNVGAVSRARRLPLEEHAEAHGGPAGGRPHDQVEVTGVEAAGDLAVGLVQPGGLLLHCPVARQGPLVEPQLRGGAVHVGLARHDAAERGEVFGALVAGVVFR
jgi:hypothetical protein